MRGRRIESLELISPRGRRTLLSRTVGAAGDFAAQQLYSVAPGGERLAWLDQGALHLLDGDGASRVIARGVSMFRFAPSGTELAFVAKGQLELVDLATSARRTLGAVPHAAWIEWLAGGFAVLTREGETRRIVYVPREGTPRVVGTTTRVVRRMVGAARGTRLAWFTSSGVFTVDVATADPPRRLDQGNEAGVTAEMAPDGAWFAYAWNSGSRVYRVDASASKTQVGSLSGAHTLWISDDGERLASAAYDVGQVRRGDQVHSLHARRDHSLETLRFRRDAPGLLAVIGNDVIAWDPERSERRVLARPLGTCEVKSRWACPRIVDADVFRGGIMVWIVRPDPTDPPRQEG